MTVFFFKDSSSLHLSFFCLASISISSFVRFHYHFSPSAPRLSSFVNAQFRWALMISFSRSSSFMHAVILNVKCVQPYDLKIDKSVAGYPDTSVCRFVSLSMSLSRFDICGWFLNHPISCRSTGRYFASSICMPFVFDFTDLRLFIRFWLHVWSIRHFPLTVEPRSNGFQGTSNFLLL